MPDRQFENFALCFKAIFTFLDGDPKRRNKVWNSCLRECRENVLPRARNFAGNVSIISQLSRFELRLAEDD